MSIPLASGTYHVAGFRGHPLDLTPRGLGRPDSRGASIGHR
jgi:hypothetical protein